MSNREFLQSRREAEYPIFIKVLKALPQDRFDYRPHERSPSAADVVWTLALETKACCDLVDSGRINWKPLPPPADPNEILAAFQEHSAALDNRRQRMNDEGWQKSAQLLINDKLARQVIDGVLAGEGEPADVVASRGLAVVSDSGTLEAAVDKAIAADPDAAQKVRDGKVQAAGALIGSVMREMRGQADAAAVRALLLQRLS